MAHTWRSLKIPHHYWSYSMISNILLFKNLFVAFCASYYIFVFSPTISTTVSSPVSSCSTAQTYSNWSLSLIGYRGDIKSHKFIQLWLISLLESIDWGFAEILWSRPEWSQAVKSHPHYPRFMNNLFDHSVYELNWLMKVDEHELHLRTFYFEA